MDYRNTRQSKKISFLWHPDKHSQYQQTDIFFSIRFVQSHSELSIFQRLFKFFSGALLVEIANSRLSGVTTENVIYPFFTY